MHIFSIPTDAVSAVADAAQDTRQELPHAVEAYLTGAVSAIAKTMLMIESGRRLYDTPDAKADPSAPFMMKDMDYCTVGMFCASAYLVVIGHDGLKRELLIDRLITMITKEIDALRSGYVHASRLVDSGVFSMTHVKYLPRPTNLISEWVHRGEERLFVMASNERELRSARAKNASFVWIINTDFAIDMDNNPVKRWLTNETTVCINLTRMVVPRDILQKDVYQLTAIILAFGIPQTAIKYIAEGRNKYIHYNPSVVDDPTVIMKGSTLKVNARTLASIDAVNLINVTDGGADFFTRFADAPLDSINTDEICQYCKKLLHETVYLFSKGIDTYVAICALCMEYEGIFRKDPFKYLPVYQYTHRRTRYDISMSRYGLTKDELKAVERARSDGGYAYRRGNIIVWLKSREPNWNMIQWLDRNLQHASTILLEDKRSAIAAS
jgi:hypothetical protein